MPTEPLSYQSLFFAMSLSEIFASNSPISQAVTLISMFSIKVTDNSDMLYEGYRGFLLSVDDKKISKQGYKDAGSLEDIEQFLTSHFSYQVGSSIWQSVE